MYSFRVIYLCSNKRTSSLIVPYKINTRYYARFLWARDENVIKIMTVAEIFITASTHEQIELNFFFSKNTQFVTRSFIENGNRPVTSPRHCSWCFVNFSRLKKKTSAISSNRVYRNAWDTRDKTHSPISNGCRNKIFLTPKYRELYVYWKNWRVDSAWGKSERFFLFQTLVEGRWNCRQLL